MSTPGKHRLIDYRYEQTSERLVTERRNIAVTKSGRIYVRCDDCHAKRFHKTDCPQLPANKEHGHG